jgi:hypothetical protein
VAHQEVAGGSGTVELIAGGSAEGGTAANAPTSPPGATNLKTAFITIYAAIALLFLLLPGAVSNWLDELPPNVMVETAKKIVEPVEQLSERIGTAYVYREIRRGFLSLARRRN